MLTHTEQEKLSGDITRASYEAVDLGDFSSKVLPLIDRLFDTSTSLVYWCNQERQIVPLAGGMVESVPFYSQNYFSIDLLQKNLLRFNPWMLHGSSMPDWKEYLSSPAYNDCATRNSIDNFLHLRLTDCEMYEPGMVGLMVARTFRQPDFDERERILVGNLMPAFETFARRNLRLDERLKTLPFLESLFEFHQRPTIVLDSAGGFRWASRQADEWLQISQNGRKTVPEALKKAAAELTKLLLKKPQMAVPPASVEISRKNGDSVHANLRLVRNRNGEYFIAIELESSEASPQLLEIAAHYQLTKTETQVLQWISLGLSDRDISHRLFVSPATVHTHVKHILAKLEVSSRLQAALVAHGRKLKSTE